MRKAQTRPANTHTHKLYVHIVIQFSKTNPPIKPTNECENRPVHYCLQDTKLCNFCFQNFTAKFKITFSFWHFYHYFKFSLGNSFGLNWNNFPSIFILILKFHLRIALHVVASIIQFSYDFMIFFSFCFIFNFSKHFFQIYDIISSFKENMRKRRFSFFVLLCFCLFFLYCCC